MQCIGDVRPAITPARVERAAEQRALIFIVRWNYSQDWQPREARFDRRVFGGTDHACQPLLPGCGECTIMRASTHGHTGPDPLRDFYVGLADLREEAQHVLR